EAAKQFPRYEAKSFGKAVRLLAGLGFLVEAGSNSAPDLMKPWPQSFPAIYFQYSSRNAVYVTEMAAKTEILEERLAEARQPPLFKDFRGHPGVTLASEGAKSARSLDSVLEERRTVRDFRPDRVPFADFAA